jgi:L-lactate dehydrogenase
MPNETLHPSRSTPPTPSLSFITATFLSSVPSNVVVLTQDLADELVLVDTKPDKLRGEMLDLQYVVAFLPHTKIHASVDYAVTVGFDLCIVTAGARQILDSSRFWFLVADHLDARRSSSAQEMRQVGIREMG